MPPARATNARLTSARAEIRLEIVSCWLILVPWLRPRHRRFEVNTLLQCNILHCNWFPADL